MLKPNPYRRKYLSGSASILAIVLAGCASSEPNNTSEYSCPDPFPVYVYNELSEKQSIMLEIRSGSEEFLFSDSVELAANTGPYDGAELDVQISDAQQYTFEVTSADGMSLSETFTAKCGPVFVSITETGELELRDDELDHLRDS